MKNRYFAHLFVALLFVACDTGNGKMQQNDSMPSPDTAGFQNGVDSMPVIKPDVEDSKSVLITPPANDDNVVIPDSSNR